MKRILTLVILMATVSLSAMDRSYDCSRALLPSYKERCDLVGEPHLTYLQDRYDSVYHLTSYEEAFFILSVKIDALELMVQAGNLSKDQKRYEVNLIRQNLLLLKDMSMQNNSATSMYVQERCLELQKRLRAC